MIENETKRQKAQQLRNEGLSYREIARALAVSYPVAYTLINPEYNEHRKEHREELRGKMDKYYKAHKEQLKKSHAQYYQQHKEEEARRWQRYYLENKEKIKARVREYNKRHLAERAAWESKRRALKRSTQPGLTDQQKAEIKEIYRRAKEDPNVRCYICGKKIPLGHRHVDHIVPLAKGGKHVPSNLAIACDECNQHKYNKSPQEIGLLL